MCIHIYYMLYSHDAFQARQLSPRELGRPGRPELISMYIYIYIERERCTYIYIYI